MSPADPRPYGARLAELGRTRPDDVAVVVLRPDGSEESLTWRGFDERARAASRPLAAAGVGPGSAVLVALGNGLGHLVATWAAWRLGAYVVPVRPDLPAPEQDRVLGLLDERTVVVGDWPGAAVGERDLRRAEPAPAGTERLPVPSPVAATSTGGSTGRPKLIVLPWSGRYGPGPSMPAAFREDYGWAPGTVQLVAGPLSHAATFQVAFLGVLDGQRLVVLERFDPELAVTAIERHRVQGGWLYPTMLTRMARLEGIGTRDLSSIVSICSTGAPCPEWVKRCWIELLGPERVWEGYGASEAVGSVSIRGDEWLAHPGSVGRPVDADFVIRDGSGRPLPVGEIGVVWSRQHGVVGPASRYVGAPPLEVDADGFMTVGDLGHLDADGYLYLADRRVDLIVTGGVNVYPAEVEGALSEHPNVADCAVVGLPDPEWGRRVHAVVVASGPLSADEVRVFARGRLAAYKVPKTVEFVARLPRDGAGKLRRRALVEERV